jgi:hypothetical protein
VAIFKANYCKRGKTERSLAKASVRYIQHRAGFEGEKITRDLFGSDGLMDRYQAYRMIDEAPKGSYFYRFVLSPDPKREDRNHDLDMRDIARHTILALEERLDQSILWVGAVHDDHAPHLHAHLIAIVPQKLTVADLTMLRGAETGAALEQRHILDLLAGLERERPYPLPAFAHQYSTAKPVPTGLKYARLGRSVAAKRETAYRQRHAFWQPSRASPFLRLYTCICPRCQTMHIHTAPKVEHTCSCGLTLHRQKERSLFTKRRGRELALELEVT